MLAGVLGGRRLGEKPPSPFWRPCRRGAQFEKDPTELAKGTAGQTGAQRSQTIARSGLMPAPRRPFRAPRPFDSPEPTGQLRGAAAERSRRAEPPGQLDQVTARAACRRWGPPGSWSERRRRPHLTRGLAGGEKERGPRPLPLAGSDPPSSGGWGGASAAPPAPATPGAAEANCGAGIGLQREAGRLRSALPECVGSLRGITLGRAPRGGAGPGSAGCLAPLPRARSRSSLPHPLRPHQGWGEVGDSGPAKRVKSSEGQLQGLWLCPGPSWWSLKFCHHERCSTFSAIT